jgi:isopentenyldiphosphate isomerase
MPEELFDIVNEDDAIIGQELRSIVHQRGLWHRGVHLLLFTHEGKLLVQQRSKDRPHAPLALDCSVSEHVKAGEDYLTAVMRGMKEEMGVEGIKVKPLVKFKMNYGPNDNEISVVYRGTVDPADVKFDPVEVEQIDYYELATLQNLMGHEEVKFSYWFEQILRWYSGKSSALNILASYSDPLAEQRNRQNPGEDNERAEQPYRS